MKKIIALLLALLCLTTLLVSCGKKGPDGETPGTDDPTTQTPPVNDEVLKSIQEAYDGAMGDVGEVTIKYFSEDGTVDHTIDAQLTMDGGLDKDDNPNDYLTIPYYNYIGIQGGNITLPDSVGGTISGNPESKADTVNFSGVTFNSAFFKDGKYTFERNKFQTVVTDCEGFFGTDLGQGTADVTITMANNAPKKIAITYETNLGYFVEIELKFTY